MIKTILKKLTLGQELSKDEIVYSFDNMMEGKLKDSQIASFLTAMQMKGVSDKEIISALKILKKKAISIKPKSEVIVDTCGTGGDGFGTFNISTVVSFVIAGAGVTVAKHGNRSASSKCGSADVLESLGVNINISPKRAEEIINKIGIVFLFAPTYHPSFKHVGKIRKEMGTKTIFNFLGPLLNPAGANRQVIGVYDSKLTEKIARVLKQSGSKHALIFNSNGMDEISTFNKTKITELKNGKIKTFEFDPSKYDFSGSIENIKGGNISKNKQIFLDIMDGKKGPKRDIVILNAAASIYVSGIVNSIEEGIKLAEKSIDLGEAKKKLNELIRLSNKGEKNE